MIGEILRELTALKDFSESTSCLRLTWAQRMEVQRVQKEVLDHLREDRWFDYIRGESTSGSMLGRIGKE